MANGPYFVPTNPSSGEQGNYERSPSIFVFTSSSFSWTWAFSIGDYTAPGGIFPSVRMLIDGVAASAFVQPVTNSYVFSVTGVEDGHHYVDFEGVTAGVIILNKGFVVNTTGAPLQTADQKPWTSRKRFENLENQLGPGVAQVTYPGTPVYPPSYNLKSRAAETYTTRLAQSALWTRAIQKNVYQSLTRRFVKTAIGDVVIEEDNRLFYPYAGNARGVPHVTLRDGPRGKGSLGHLFTCLMSPGDNGFYYAAKQGNIGFCRFLDGDVRTIAGWRLIDGELKYTTSLASDLAYDDQWENAGDWTLVDGEQQFNETWSVAATLDARVPTFYREFWCTDTVNNRVIYINDFTSQLEVDYLQPAHPPTGYSAPVAPTGEAQLVTFLDRDKLAGLGFTAQEQADMLNEPWGIAVNPAGTKVYWTNFGSGTICRADLDGANPEIVFQTAVYPSDATLGITNRLTSQLVASTVRASHCADGADGVWKGVRPQAIDFMSDGNPVWSDRYAFNIRKGNLGTGAVSTIANLSITGIGFAEYDMNLAIDRDGTVGPADDIFGAVHNGFTDFRFSSAGVSFGRPFFQGDTTNASLIGPLSASLTPAYAWGIAIGSGRIVFQGGASGWQIYDITKKKVTDPTPNHSLFRLGKAAFEFGSNPPMALTHGAYGQAELGELSMEQMGALSDADLDTYALANGIPATAAGSIGGLTEFRHFVRWLTTEIDYSAGPPPSLGGRRKMRVKFADTPTWLGSVAVNQWISIPGTKLSTLGAAHPEWFEAGLCTEPGGQSPGGPPGGVLNWPFQDYAGAMFAAWCGAAIDTRSSTVYGGPGGGHNDYYGNQGYRCIFSVNSPVMEETAPTSAAVEVILNSRLYADGRPTARHSMFSPQFIEARNRYMVFGTTSTAGHGGADFPNITSLNPVTLDWDPDNTFPDAPFPIRVDATIFKDPATENVYVWEDRTFMRWNQATNTWTAIFEAGPHAAFQQACVDTRRNRAIAISGTSGTVSAGVTYSGPVVIDLATNEFTSITLTGPNASVLAPLAAPSALLGQGIVFHQHLTDPTQDCFLVRTRTATGGTIYRVNAVTFFVDQLATTGGSLIPAPHFGVQPYSRFLRCPQYGGILYGPRADQDWWFLRLR
jgi:hypothetical protein